MDVHVVPSGNLTYIVAFVHGTFIVGLPIQNGDFP
jgi:hypothetical protein